MSRVTVWSRRCWRRCGASVYRRTGWAGWRMCWEPCPVVLRLPFGERAGLLGDSLFSTSSWSLSLFLSCSAIGGFPSYLLTLPSTIKRIEHDFFVTFASSPRFSTRCLINKAKPIPSPAYLCALAFWHRLSAYRKGRQFSGEDVLDSTGLPFNLYNLISESVVFP